MQDIADADLPHLPDAMIRRLGRILAIHQALRFLFVEPARAYAWVHRPNEVFGDASAIDVMLRDADAGLALVKDYLEAETSGA